MRGLRALAPAKINLGLTVGPVRAADGRHELVSVMQSISLADELVLEAAGPAATADEVLCAGISSEENLATRALREFRLETRWDAPPLRITIEKRIPVAAGLAGGSADAAATLRLARAASGLGDEDLLRSIATTLGADVPAQVAPGRWLATGAGEDLQALPAPEEPLGVLVLPVAAELSTAAVYAEADRLRLTRDRDQLLARRGAMVAALGSGEALPADPGLLGNDLQRAALSLCPEIARALMAARDCGAEHVLVSGSGPTVLGLFGAAGGASGPARARAAADEARGREPAPIAAASVGEKFAAAKAAVEGPTAA